MTVLPGEQSQYYGMMYNDIMHGSSKGKKEYLFAATVLMIVTFVVRIWGLTATSLWYDEVFVLTHAQDGPVQAVIGLLGEDNALPFHGLLVAVWIQIAGSGEFAARYLSVLLGTVTTPLIIRLSGTLMRKRYSGLGGGMAFATLPIFVYYTQEVRMYALAIPISAAYAWMAIRLYHQGKNGVLYTILGISMLATHLYTGILWAVCLVWGLIGIAFKKTGEIIPGKYVPWMRANAHLLFGALPLVVWALWRVNIDATATSAIPLDVIRWIPVAFGIGQYIPSPWAEVFIIAAFLSMLLGCFSLIRNQCYANAVWIGLSLFLPIFLLICATLVKAKWSERYLLPSFGLGFVTSVGLGWDIQKTNPGNIASHAWRTQGLRMLSLSLLALWLLGTLPAIKRQTEGTYALAIQDEWHPKPDFRSVAQYIQNHDSPDDVVVVVAGYAAHTLAYYYDGPAHLTGLPANTRLLNTKQILDLNALHTLEQETHGYNTLWLVLWQQRLIDPTNIIESTLIASCKRLPVHETFTNIGLLRFDLTGCRPIDTTTTPPIPFEVDFMAPIQIKGYDLQKRNSLWEVDLWWKNTSVLDENYTVFVHLVNQAGEIVAQHDHIAGADAYPTSQWREGTLLRDRFFLDVPGNVCEDCVLHIGLYTDENRLLLRNGQDTIVIEINH
jgi:uncharacterized membrane protein